MKVLALVDRVLDPMPDAVAALVILIAALSPIVVAGLVLWTVEPVVITTIKAVLA
jgi:hypothetical protein